MTDDPLMRPSQAAKMLGVSTETVWRWLRKGAIEHEEVGPYNRKRIRRSVVDAQRRSVPQSANGTSDNIHT